MKAVSSISFMVFHNLGGGRDLKKAYDIDFRYIYMLCDLGNLSAA